MIYRMIALMSIGCGLAALAGGVMAAGPNLSTPQATAKSRYNAVQAGDGAAVREILARIRRLGKGELRATALPTSWSPVRKLEDAVRSKYGQGDANFAAGNDDQGPTWLSWTRPNLKSRGIWLSSHRCGQSAAPEIQTGGGAMEARLFPDYAGSH